MLSSSGILVKFITFYCVKQLKPESFCCTRLSNRPAGLTVHWSLHRLTVFVPVKNDEASRPTGQPVTLIKALPHFFFFFVFVFCCESNTKKTLMANRTPKAFLLLSLISFFDAGQKRKRRWRRTEYPRPFFFLLCFRFLMPFKNEKDDDGEQNTLRLSSSFFVFVFWCESKNEKAMMANRIP